MIRKQFLLTGAQVDYLQVFLAASALLHFVTTLLVCQEAIPLEAIGTLACRKSDQHLKSR